MIAIRQIHEHLADVIEVPPELRNRKAEVILLAMDGATAESQMKDQEHSTPVEINQSAVRFFGSIPDFPERVTQGECDSRLELKRFHSVSAQEKCICSIVAAELFYGAAKSQRRQDTLNQLGKFMACFRFFDFDLAAAYQFDEIRAELERSGRPVGPFDMQIALIAKANQLIVVTHNLSEFSRVPELVCEDW